MDRYGRLVGKVILLDDRTLSHELIKAGLVWRYRTHAPGGYALERQEREEFGAVHADADPVTG